MFTTSNTQLELTRHMKRQKPVWPIPGEKLANIIRHINDRDNRIIRQEFKITF